MGVYGRQTMHPEMRTSPYGPHFDTLSLPAQLAVGRYLEAMKQLYPDLATRAVVGPGNEGTVYVYIPLPLDDERNIEVHETMAEIGAQTVADTGIVVVLMPWSAESLPVTVP
jgi:hypothetical protein